MSVLDDFQDDFVVDLGPDIAGLVLKIKTKKEF